MKLFFFSGPEVSFFVHNLGDGERILHHLWIGGWIDEESDIDDYTATEVEVELK